MKAKNFEEYFLSETTLIQEGQITYIGDTTIAEELPISEPLKSQGIKPPHNFCKHIHHYSVYSDGTGWTSIAEEGSSHEHRILKWVIMSDGTHAHQIIKPSKQSNDSNSLQVPVVTIAS